MSQTHHLSIQRGKQLRELLCNFVALDPQEFLCTLYSMLSEAQWDRVKESWPTILLLYNYDTDREKNEDLTQLITDVATESDHINLILQESKGGPFKVFTYGNPKDNRFIFVRDTDSEVAYLCEEIDSGNTLVIQVV